MAACTLCSGLSAPALPGARAPPLPGLGLPRALGAARSAQSDDAQCGRKRRASALLGRSGDGHTRWSPPPSHWAPGSVSRWPRAVPAAFSCGGSERARAPGSLRYRCSLIAAQVLAEEAAADRARAAHPLCAHCCHPMRSTLGSSAAAARR